MREELSVPTPEEAESIEHAAELGGPGSANATPGDEKAIVQRMDDGRVRHLDPARISAERVSALIIILVLLLPVLGGLAFMWLLADWSDMLRWGLSLGSVLLLGVLGLLMYCWPPMEHRRTTWRVSAEGVEIRRGVVWRHVISVPRRRIQHTDVSQGPVQRRFGLGTLIMHTAGTHSYEVRLEGIAHGTALLVRDALLSKPKESNVVEAQHEVQGEGLSRGHEA